MNIIVIIIIIDYYYYHYCYYYYYHWHYYDLSYYHYHDFSQAGPGSLTLPVGYGAAPLAAAPHAAAVAAAIKGGIHQGAIKGGTHQGAIKGGSAITQGGVGVIAAGLQSNGSHKRGVSFGLTGMFTVAACVKGGVSAITQTSLCLAKKQLFLRGSMG